MPLSNWPPTPFCCCANPAPEWVGRCVVESPPAPAPTIPRTFRPPPTCRCSTAPPPPGDVRSSSRVQFLRPDSRTASNPAAPSRLPEPRGALHETVALERHRSRHCPNSTNPLPHEPLVATNAGLARSHQKSRQIRDSIALEAAGTPPDLLHLGQTPRKPHAPSPCLSQHSRTSAFGIRGEPRGPRSKIHRSPAANFPAWHHSPRCCK